MCVRIVMHLLRGHLKLLIDCVSVSTMGEEWEIKSRKYQQALEELFPNMDEMKEGAAI